MARLYLSCGFFVSLWGRIGCKFEMAWTSRFTISKLRRKVSTGRGIWQSQ